MVRKKFPCGLLALIAVATLPGASVFACETEVGQAVPMTNTVIVQCADNNENLALVPEDVIGNTDQEEPAVEIPVIQEVASAIEPVAEEPVMSETIAEGPVIEEPGAETLVIEVPSAEIPASGRETVKEELVALEDEQQVEEEIIPAEKPIIEEPVAVPATVTIVHRLHVIDEVMEYSETVEGFMVGDELDLTPYQVKRYDVELITNIDAIHLENQNVIVLEYQFIFGK